MAQAGACRLHRVGGASSASNCLQRAMLRQPTSSCTDDPGCDARGIDGFSFLSGCRGVRRCLHLPLMELNEVGLAVVGGDSTLCCCRRVARGLVCWREVMPALAREHAVVAVDSRSARLSDKPDDGYDAGALAADLVALMAALGHDRFDVDRGIGMSTDTPSLPITPSGWAGSPWVDTVSSSRADPVGLQPGRGQPAALALELRRARRPRRGAGQGAGAALLRLPVRKRQPPRTRSQRMPSTCTSTRSSRTSRAAGELAHLPGVGRDDRAERAAQEDQADAAGARRRRRAVQRRGVAETMRLAADDVTGVVLDDCGHYAAEEQPARFTEILEDFLDGKPVAGVPHG